MVVAVLLGLECFFAGLIPFIFAKFKQAERIMNASNAAAGGLFLSAGLCHMLVDAQENFDELLKNSDNISDTLSSFPFVMFLFGIGFFFILFIEHICVQVHKEDSVASYLRREDEESDTEGDPSFRNISTSINSDDEEALLKTTMDRKRFSRHRGLQYVLTCVFLTLALSVHSFITGLALGVQSEMSELLVTWVAVLAHKWAESAALTIAFITAGLSTRLILLLLALYSLVTPIAVAIGTVITTILTGNASLLVTGILEAIATGTFCYVSVYELLGEAFHNGKDRVVKFLLSIFFFTAMAVVAIWA